MKLIDVASYQHPNGKPIDWAAVAAAGVGGVYVKATQGLGYVNPFFHSDSVEATAAGLLVGAYHFADFATNDGGAEAQHFLETLGGFPFTLPHMLDLETGSFAGWSLLANRRDQWFDKVDGDPSDSGLYVNLNYLNNLPGGAVGRLLWLADPSPAPRADCWLWQYGIEDVPGVPAPVDVDLLIGTLPGGANGGKTMLNGKIVGPPIYTPDQGGYWLIGADGGVFAFGNAWNPPDNPLPGMKLAAPITGGACTKSGLGLLLVGEDGGVFPLGDAVMLGNLIGR